MREQETGGHIFNMVRERGFKRGVNWGATPAAVRVWEVQTPRRAPPHRPHHPPTTYHSPTPTTSHPLTHPTITSHPTHPPVAR